MTPKQKYDERKRLRLENDLRREQAESRRMDSEEDTKALFFGIARSLQRLADVAELWADMQAEKDPLK